VRDHSVFGNYNDAFANIVKGMVQVFGLARRRNDTVVANAGILIDDGIFNAGVTPDPNAGPAGLLTLLNRFRLFEVVAPEQNRPVQSTVPVY